MSFCGSDSYFHRNIRYAIVSVCKCSAAKVKRKGSHITNRGSSLIAAGPYDSPQIRGVPLGVLTIGKTQARNPTEKQRECRDPRSELAFMRRSWVRPHVNHARQRNFRRLRSLWDSSIMHAAVFRVACERLCRAQEESSFSPVLDKNNQWKRMCYIRL